MLSDPAGADRAQEKTIADTKQPIPIPTEQEAVAPEAFPNPSEVSTAWCTVTLLSVGATGSAQQPNASARFEGQLEGCQRVHPKCNKGQSMKAVCMGH